MPGNATAAAATGRRGIFTSFTAERGTLTPPILSSAGGGAEHSCSPQRTFRPRGDARRRRRSCLWAEAFGGLVAQAEIGIIGGRGLYAMPGLSKIKEVRVKTPFGAPSEAYVCGVLEGRKVAFLARHGRGHRILPSELNFRANVYGFKQLGVERIVSVSAVGSLKEEHKPLDFVIPDQFFDRTRHRVATFFGAVIVRR